MTLSAHEQGDASEISRNVVQRSGIGGRGQRDDVKPAGSKGAERIGPRARGRERHLQRRRHRGANRFP